MRLEIPKIVEKLNLSDYAKEFGDQTMSVWVNPDRETNKVHDTNVDVANALIKKLAELNESKKEKGDDWFEATGKKIQEDLVANLEEANRKVTEWYSLIWSQGEEATKVAPEEVEALAEKALETDPMFFQWLCESTLEMIVAHRVNRKN
jgi:hypothetical protein